MAYAGVIEKLMASIGRNLVARRHGGGEKLAIARRLLKQCARRGSGNHGAEACGSSLMICAAARAQGLYRNRAWWRRGEAALAFVDRLVVIVEQSCACAAAMQACAAGGAGMVDAGINNGTVESKSGGEAIENVISACRRDISL